MKTSNPIIVVNVSWQ